MVIQRVRSGPAGRHRHCAWVPSVRHTHTHTQTQTHTLVAHAAAQWVSCPLSAPGGSCSSSWPGWRRTRRCPWSSCTRRWSGTRERGWVQEARTGTDAASYKTMKFRTLCCVIIGSGHRPPPRPAFMVSQVSIKGLSGISSTQPLSLSLSVLQLWSLFTGLFVLVFLGNTSQLLLTCGSPAAVIRHRHSDYRHMEETHRL